MLQSKTYEDSACNSICYNLDIRIQGPVEYLKKVFPYDFVIIFYRFFFNLNQVSYSFSKCNCLKLYFSYFNYSILEDDKSLSTNYVINLFQEVIDLWGSYPNHKFFSSEKENVNNLRRIASWLAPGRLYEVHILIKFIRCMLTSSVGRPPNTSFKFSNWIILLISA